jgi:hypothetical protein
VYAFKCMCNSTLVLQTNTKINALEMLPTISRIHVCMYTIHLEFSSEETVWKLREPAQQRLWLLHCLTCCRTKPGLCTVFQVGVDTTETRNPSAAALQSLSLIRLQLLREDCWLHWGYHSLSGRDWNQNLELQNLHIKGQAVVSSYTEICMALFPKNLAQYWK